VHYRLGKPLEIEKAVAEFQETHEGAGESINKNRSKNGKTRGNDSQYVEKSQLRQLLLNACYIYESNSSRILEHSINIA
jgi:hypothetical protein